MAAYPFPLPCPFNGLMTRVGHGSTLDLVGAQRGFHTREKSPLDGGMSGVEMTPGSSLAPANVGRRRTLISPMVVRLYLRPHQVEVEEDHRSREVYEPLTPDLSPSYPKPLFPDAVGHSRVSLVITFGLGSAASIKRRRVDLSKMRHRRIHRSM